MLNSDQSDDSSNEVETNEELFKKKDNKRLRLNENSKRCSDLKKHKSNIYNKKTHTNEFTVIDTIDSTSTVVEESNSFDNEENSYNEITLENSK